ncbi:MAG: CPXCG motif-containing cysteine-rich protein [Gemmatimonadales bacterium]
MRFVFDDDADGVPDDEQPGHDFDLERDFPLGDGTADTSGSVVCPYCGEESSVGLDPGGGATQDYIEDCPVCCQPWHVTLHYRGDGTAVVHVAALDD